MGSRRAEGSPGSAHELGLDEGLKWGKPCFMVEGKNVAIIQPFKEHCSFMFFKGALKADRKLAAAFRALTPGRQRAYVLHFAGAKQSKTRTARIERCIPGILAGKGMNDR